MNIWDNGELLEKLDRKRTLKRLQEVRSHGEKGRITFDCMRAIVVRDRVLCSKGHSLGTIDDKSVAVLQVLKGVTSGNCRKCGDFIG